MCLTQLRNASTLVAVEPVLPSPRDAQQANSIEQQSGHGTIADPFLGPTTRVSRTIVGVRVGLMTRHRFGSLFSLFRTDAPCAVRHCDGCRAAEAMARKAPLPTPIRVTIMPATRSTGETLDAVAHVVTAVPPAIPPRTDKRRKNRPSNGGCP
jgi:hypothetical protein